MTEFEIDKAQAAGGCGNLIVRLRLLLLVRLGIPDLILRWPRGLWRGVVAIASPSACLSSFEYWTRYYYEHIALNFKSAGRLGYVWDEALGVPFGPRIYNNTLTYRLYGALSPKAFRLLTLAAYLGAIIGLGISGGHGMLGLLLALIIFGSPAGLHSLVGYMLKPEVPWWSLAMIAAGSAVGGHWPMAFAACGLLLLGNASVSAITAFLIGPLWILTAWNDGTLPGGASLAWLIPGAVKMGVRILQARAEGMGREVTADQKKAARRNTVSIRELVNLALWFGIPLLLCGAFSGSATLLLGAAATLFWLTNRHVVKVADTVTVLLALLTVLAALTLTSGEWWGLVGIAWFTYYQPFTAYPAMSGQAAAEAHKLALAGSPSDRLRALQTAARDFPWFSSRGLPECGKVVSLLAAIPDGARVLLESDGDGRWAGTHLHFRNWADSIVARRNVELVNQFFLVRVVEPVLADLYLDQFTAKRLGSGTMLEICQALGASFVLAFTPDTVAALEATGFQRVTEVSAEEMADLADELHMPITGIVLLASPGEPAVVEPTVSLVRCKNSLSWNAKAGQDYLVRYRYHGNFVARQGEAPIDVTPYSVIDGLPLRFMRVQASADGLLELEFRPRWLG